jgi:hypothetical protein
VTLQRLRPWRPRSVTLGRCYIAHLGDTLCLTPLPRLLSAVYGVPVYLTDEPIHLRVFRNNPHVAGFRGGDGVRMERRIGGRGHLLQRFQRQFGLACSGDPRPEIYLSDSEKQWAAAERATWPADRPVCIFSPRVVAEAGHYRGVDWQAIGEAWGKSCTVVQPVLTRPDSYAGQIAGLCDDQNRTWRAEPLAPDAVVYEDLPLRKYLALFSVADSFCGGNSGGSHVAAAFGLPSLIVVWRALLTDLRFPVRSETFSPTVFLYPQHDFIAADELQAGRMNPAALIDRIAAVRRRPVCRTLGDAGPEASAFPAARILRRPSRTWVRTAKGRMVCLPTLGGPEQAPIWREAADLREIGT